VFQKLKQFLNEFDLEDGQAISISCQNLDIKEKFLFNENETYYPASLIKLFAALRACEKINAEELDEFIENDLKVAIRNSLEESDNDALSLLYDFISDSQSGLYDKKTFAKFSQARKSLTKYFQEQGFSSELALHNKCYSFAPYGRDLKLFLNEGSNQVLISDLEKIIFQIIENEELLESMLRDGDDEQSEFIYAGLDAKKLDFFYSKAGWTTSVRHDAAYFSFQGQKYLMIILTKGLSAQKDLVSKLASLVFSAKND
jgi:hypothetical protein